MRSLAFDPKRTSRNCLVDHLVDTGEHRETGGDGERFLRIQIDPQGQFRRLLNGKAELLMGGARNVAGLQAKLGERR
jgi:hypothetical protein